MNIVFLDATTLGKDVSLAPLDQFGELKIYDHTSDDEVAARIKYADIIVTNKVKLHKGNLKEAMFLKMICVTATGTNNIDLAYCKENEVIVSNVSGYSTDSVTQHTFALLFYMYEKLPYYDNYVRTKKYVDDTMFTHFGERFHQIKDKTWGIIGLGNIGKKVATIAQAFGANVQYYSTSGMNLNKKYKQVDFDTLLATSDIISIHAPLNENTIDLLQYEELKKMKRNSYLINVGRGAIINEIALAKTLQEGHLAGVALDVLEVEPMAKDSALLNVLDDPRLVITPHIAWASVEARNKVVEEVVLNIRGFMRAEPRNNLTE